MLLGGFNERQIDREEVLNVLGSINSAKPTIAANISHSTLSQLANSFFYSLPSAKSMDMSTRLKYPCRNLDMLKYASGFLLYFL